MLRNTLILMAVLGVAACGKSDDKKGGDKKPATKTFTLKRVNNLKVDLPPSAKISKGIMGKGVMIMAPDLVISVTPAGPAHPKTLKEAKENAKMFKPKKMSDEKLEDGWVLTFENKGGLGTNYFVKVRRVIGGKAYMCTTTASRPAQKTNALKACKSIKG